MLTKANMAAQLAGHPYSADNDRVQKVKYYDLKRGDNDRTTFDQQELEELAQSILKSGIRQPPVVRRIPPTPICLGCFQRQDQPNPDCPNHNENGHVAWLEIVAGERRTRAMRDVLKWRDIPAVVQDMDDETAEDIMLIENVQRKDLNAMEEARAYGKRVLRHTSKRDQDAEVARLVQQIGKSAIHIRNRLKLLVLPEKHQILVAKNELPLKHAEVIATLAPDGGKMDAALDIWKAGCDNLRQFQIAVQRIAETDSMHDMFDLLDVWKEQLAIQLAEEPGKKKDMYTGLKTRKDLPSFEDLKIKRDAGSVDVALHRWEEGAKKTGKLSAREIELIEHIRHQLLTGYWTNPASERAEAEITVTAKAAAQDATKSENPKRAPKEAAPPDPSLPPEWDTWGPGKKAAWTKRNRPKPA